MHSYSVLTNRELLISTGHDPVQFPRTHLPRWILWTAAFRGRPASAVSRPKASFPTPDGNLGVLRDRTYVRVD